MKTAVIYARYSSDSQTEQSIEGQLRVCEEYAKTHEILILNTYIDRAMSGTNDNRPDFQKMLKDSNAKKWDYVLCYKLDRFSRNKYEMAMHKKTLRDNGIKVISATEFIPDSPEGIILESMLEGYAEYYSAELSQKIKRGNNESRRKGNLTGGRVPFGYKRDGKKAVIDEENAEVVRYIFTESSKGVYVKDIIAELERKGITYYGKKFVKQTVYKLLANERYSGIYTYNGEVFDNIYPRIVPQDIFDTVQKKLQKNKYGMKPVKAEYLLRHKVKCGYCKSSIVAESGTSRNGDKKFYYKCRSSKNGNGCHSTAIPKDILESLVMEHIKKSLDTENINKIIDNLLFTQEQQAKSNTVLNLLTKEKKQTETGIDNLMSAILKGVVTETTTAKLKELETKKKELERQILVEQSKTAIQLTETRLREYFETGIQLENKLLIDYFIKEIILYDDRIEIIYKNPLTYSPDYENGQGFSFYTKEIRYTYKIAQRKECVIYDYKITMRI